VGLHENLSNDKQSALRNLEICKEVSKEFEEFLSIFTSATQSGKLTIDTEMEEQLIGSFLWAPLTIMLITETAEKASWSVGFALDVESSKIAKKIKRSSSKLGISYDNFINVVQQIYPTLRNESFENARVGLYYWREIMKQVDTLKINENNIDKKWSVFFKSIDFTQ